LLGGKVETTEHTEDYYAQVVATTLDIPNVALP